MVSIGMVFLANPSVLQELQLQVASVFAQVIKHSTLETVLEHAHQDLPKSTINVKLVMPHVRHAQPQSRDVLLAIVDMIMMQSATDAQSQLYAHTVNIGQTLKTVALSALKILTMLTLLAMLEDAQLVSLLMITAEHVSSQPFQMVVTHLTIYKDLIVLLYVTLASTPMHKTEYVFLVQVAVLYVQDHPHVHLAYKVHLYPMEFV